MQNAAAAGRLRSVSITHLDAIFHDPDGTVGENERNVEARVVVPILEALGWDLGRQVALSFHIPASIAMTAQPPVADIALAKTPRQLAAVGEIKHWFRRDFPDAFEEQLRKYTTWLGAPLSFLTNGRQWVIYDGNMKRLKELGGNEVSPAKLIEELEEYLSPNKCTPCAFAAGTSWEYGLRVRGVAAPTRKDGTVEQDGLPENAWMPDAWPGDDNAGVREFLNRMNELRAKYSRHVHFDRGSGALMLKFRTRAGSTKLFEFKPGQSLFALNTHDHREKLKTPEPAFAAYEDALQTRNRQLRSPADAVAIADTIEGMILALRRESPLV